MKSETKLKLWKSLDLMGRGWAVYTIVVICWFAVQYVEIASLYPISYHTVGWILSLSFPLVAICFMVCSLHVRYREIDECFASHRLWIVYCKEKSQDEGKLEFSRLLWKHVNEYYDLREFVVYSLLAGAFTFVAYYLLIMVQLFSVPFKTGIAPDVWKLEGPAWAILAASGFLGSLSGSFVFMLRRYRLYDLRPITFLQVFVVLFAGTCAGAFITIIYPEKQMGVLAFIIGFLSAINVDFLPNLMRSHFAKLTGTQLPKEIESNLPTVVSNTEAIESLNAMSIRSICDLANSDPIRLYLNMPQQIGMINAMIDKAILHCYFSAVVGELAGVNIHRFTQLVLAIAPTFSSESVHWPNIVSIIDNGGAKDSNLLRTVQGIVEGRLHHRVLGILLRHYRESFF